MTEYETKTHKELKDTIFWNKSKVKPLKEELEATNLLIEALDAVDKYNDLKKGKPIGGMVYIVSVGRGTLPAEIHLKDLTSEHNYLRNTLRKLNEEIWECNCEINRRIDR